MKIWLLLLIRFYWAVIPKGKRRKCIFRISCSQYVYQITKTDGLYKGLLAFKYRFKHCRGGFHIFENPIDGRKNMILSNAEVLIEEEISERLIG